MLRIADNVALPPDAATGRYVLFAKSEYGKTNADAVLAITPAGFEQLGAEIPATPQIPAEVLDVWRGALKAGARAMLDELVRIHPKALTRAQLGDRVKITASGETRLRAGRACAPAPSRYAPRSPRAPTEPAWRARERPRRIIATFCRRSTFTRIPSPARLRLFLSAI